MGPTAHGTVAIATQLVQAGASVLLVARGEDLLRRAKQELAPLATRPGQRVISTTGDVSLPESCAAVVAQAREALPNLTALVNNAGIYGPIGPTEEVDWEGWVEAIRVNLLGTLLMCRAVIPQFKARGYDPMELRYLFTTAHYRSRLNFTFGALKAAQ